MTDAPDLKAGMRRRTLLLRDALPADMRARLGDRLADHVGSLDLPAPSRIAGFWPIRSEIDPRPLLARLAAAGHGLGLPVILADRVTMIFRRYAPGDALEPASFGLSVPPEAAGEIDPDILLVPLAAFDRRGYRIGYGAGHYDRALARLESVRRRLKIGLAFACQEVDRVPEDVHDIALDLVLTENGPIDCRTR